MIEPMRRSHFHRFVPERYWLRTGLDRYEFVIVSSSHFAVRNRRLGDGTVEAIPASLPYSQLVGGEIRHFLLPFGAYSALCEALMLLSRLTVGNRAHRYLTVYKAYEIVTERPDQRYKAIRNAITHAGSLLTSGTTVTTLNEILGTRFMNLNRSRDRTQFFVALARMLMATDTRLARYLTYAKRKIEFTSESDIVWDFEIDL